MTRTFKELENEPKFLAGEFEEFEFTQYVHQVDTGLESGTISVFGCTVNDIEKLNTNWDEVSNIICADYQTTLKSEFDRWNIYLVFFCEEIIDRKIKYQIENDKHFMRKIVCDFYTNKADKLVFINKQLLGSDLPSELISESKRSSMLTLSDLSNHLLDQKLPIDNTDEAKKLRKEWLDQIVSNINLVNHEA